MTATTSSRVELDITPVGGVLGAEVRGVDLACCTDDDFAAVEQSLLEHLVLFFPDQQLDPDEHRAFATRFGEAEIHPYIPKLDDAHQEIVVLDSEDGGRADVWHTDVTFSQSPPICSVLQMMVCPSRGGDTMFTNQYLAYETLSAPVRDLVDGLTAVHTARVFGLPEHTAEHPVVRVHPRTDRKSLYVNRTFTSHFPQLRRTESDALLAMLCTHSEQPELTCRYSWAEGTVGIWDNRVTQHYAINDYAEPRRIHRVTIVGDVPEGDAPRWPAHDDTGSPLRQAHARR